MRTNGLLYAEIRTSGGVNEYGEPNGDSVQWSENPIECSITPNNDNRLGKYEDGEFHQASYTLLIESQEFDADTIKIVRDGVELGEFRIISINPLSLGRIQLLV